METRRGLFVVLADFRDGIAQRLFSGQPRIQKIQPSIPQAPEGPAVSGNVQGAQVSDVLIEQARILRELGRADEARIFAKRALELQPEQSPALAEMGLPEVGTAAQKQLSRQDVEVQRALSNAASMIAMGRLRPAKAEIDRVERLQPGLPEIQRLRERLAQKNEELAREQDEQQASQAEAARRMEARERRSRRIQELYTQGSYGEARSLLDESLTEVPNDPQAVRLQSRTIEALRSLSLYEAAINARKYQDAADALALLEQANPADPNLAGLRRRLDSQRAVAKASLSIYRLRDAGSILLDGQPIGTQGEVINHAVGIGSHLITLRTERGSQASQAYEFAEGQNVHIVYDATLPLVRLMLDTDRTFIAERKIKEEVYRFEVEHSHGLLRGSCEGELLISYYEVVFNPRSGSHGFRIPFSNLRLRSEGNALRLVQTGNSREVAQFRTPDPASAGEIVQLWSRLKALER
jgi:tetratricopeptide (TPR) repeat protein